MAWAEAGVGAVATQSFVDPSYGKNGLDLMRGGKSAPDTLKELLAKDEASEVRQVAMIDAQGRVEAWTGKNDIQAAGHIVGKNFSVQANLMLNDKVWPAMARAFENTKGDLAERMLAALDAAQAVGGDIRGRQSAALIVVTGKPTGQAWKDRIFDLRVDDSPQPLRELRRLVRLQRAYNHMNAGDLAVEKKDNEGALREYSAAEKLVPDNAEMIYWHAVALVNMGRVDESLPLFRKVFAMDRNWITLTPRLPKSGLLPDDPKIIQRIVVGGVRETEQIRTHRLRVLYNSMSPFLLTPMDLSPYKKDTLAPFLSPVVVNRGPKSMRTLTPGQWYLRFTCEHCNAKQILFPDLSRGEAKIKATYVVECSSCFHKGSTTATTSNATSILQTRTLDSVAQLIGPFNYQTQSHDEVKNSYYFRVAPVVMDQAAREETYRSAQRAESQTA